MIEGLETISKVFAENLKSLRGERTQAAVAEAAGLPLRTYQSLEAGVIPRLPRVRQQLARALGVSESRLFIDPEYMPKPSKDAALQILRTSLALIERLPERLLKRLAAMDQAEISALEDVLGLNRPAPAQDEKPIRRRAGDQER